MTDLDDKLIKLLHQYANYRSGNHDLDDHEATKVASQIKQAFADEHYVQVPAKIKNLRFNEDLEELPKGYMTGQEWYTKFLKEANKLKMKNFDLMTDFYLEAAKRAGGLE